jgi:lipopolysaccharide/colanic/teichoic acid biosynthesis glycosyltransferase
MILKKWDDFPENMQTVAVKKYYDILSRKKYSLMLKRIFDIFAALIMVIFLSPAFLIISFAVMADSRGGVFFRQVRVTTYGRHFYIYKFRTMVSNAEKIGSQVTLDNDMRITKVGKFLRYYRLDEIPQLFNIITGDMTFVGTRPEVVKYVERYTDEMMATLLLPGGVTSEASIMYKDENKLLSGAVNPDDIYVNKVLTEKMKYNLLSIEKFSFRSDIRTMIRTAFAVTGKEHKPVIEEPEINNIGVDV